MPAVSSSHPSIVRESERICKNCEFQGQVVAGGSGSGQGRPLDTVHGSGNRNDIDGKQVGILAASRRYFTNDDSNGKSPSGLKRLGRAKQREYLLYWFHRNFEDPQNQTPYAEKDDPSESNYNYIWGGPYDAKTELWEEFGDTVSEALIDSVVDEVQRGGFIEWAPGDEHPDTRQAYEDSELRDLERNQEQPGWRRSAGVIVSSLRAGERFGKPLREPAHLTPRYPRGIKNSDLKAKTRAIQRETALWWFHLNFEPYDASKYGGSTHGYGQGGGYGTGGYGKGGYGGSGYASAPLQAHGLLENEFGGALPDEMIEELGKILEGNWAWKQPPAATGNLGLGSEAEAFAALVPIFDQLSVALKSLELSPTYGGIGHNNPPDAIPLTEVERAEIVAELDEAKVEAEIGGDNASLTRAWWKIGPKLAKLADWTLDRLNDFFTEASKEAGKTVGKWGPHYIWLKALIGIGGLSLLAEHLIRSLPTH